jgi:hypothetical protein
MPALALHMHLGKQLGHTNMHSHENSVLIPYLSLGDVVVT